MGGALNETGAAREGRPTPSTRLIGRLRAMGLPVPDDSEIRRTYAGIHQRRDGAWSWTVDPGSGSAGVGSQFPVAEVLRAGRLIAVKQYGNDWDWHVLPWDGKPAKHGEILEAEPCAGSGTPWGSGTGTPICRVCHVGPGGLGVKRPTRRGQKWSGKVPQHVRRTA